MDKQRVHISVVVDRAEAYNHTFFIFCNHVMLLFEKAHPNVMYRLRTKPSLLLLRLYNLFGSQSGLYADIALVVLECQTGLLGGFYSSYL